MDFFGKASDFATTRDMINTNGGLGGIPYSSGTSNATCLAKAQSMGALAVASLTNLGLLCERQFGARASCLRELRPLPICSAVRAT
jgi:hypothetical protein